MTDIKLSCIIPDYKDPLLHKTIDSLLDNSGLGDKLEVIAVLDGCWSTIPFRDDPRLKVVHLGKNGGMRNAINMGVRVAKGEYLLRSDEHCMFANNYDLIMTSQCESNWIMTARRYYLDPVKWEVMDLPPVEHEKLVIQGGVKFAGHKWPERDLEQKDVPISETLAMQGSMWLMPHKWWDDVIGELQTEGYGPLIQDSHEMVFKTWKAGGKLMLNKNTWYAHKHRSFARTHNNGTKETPANCDAGYKYALDTWGEYYNKEIKPKWNL
jgi:glycosyltransferase involved in cell wall biosynthesis